MATIVTSTGEQIVVPDFQETPVDWRDTMNADIYETAQVTVDADETIVALDLDDSGQTVNVRLDLDDVDALIESLQRARRAAIRNGATYRPAAD